MRLNIVIIFLFLFTKFSYSQNSIFYWKFSLGGSIPINSFGDKSIYEENSGFANVGFNMKIIGGIKFNDKLSALMYLSPNYLSTNFSNLSNYYTSYYGNTNTVTSGQYLITNFFLGMNYKPNISEKVFLNLYGLFGLTSARSPEVKYSFSNGDELVQSKSNSENFGFSIGSDLGYSISKRVDLLLGMEFMYSNLKFDINTKYNSTNTPSKINLPLLLLNPNLGIIYKF